MPKGDVRGPRGISSHANQQQVLKAQLQQQQQLQLQIEQMQRRMQLQMQQMSLQGGAALQGEIDPTGLLSAGASGLDAPVAGGGLAQQPRGPPVASLQGGAGGGGRSTTSGIRKIFVGGLHYDTGEEQLSGYFSTFGEIDEVQVMYNRETNKSRGFGFVTFMAAESADLVLQDRMHVIDRKSVEVKLAVPKSEVGGGRMRGPDPRRMGPPMGGGRGGYGGGPRGPGGPVGGGGRPQWGGGPAVAQERVGGGAKRGAWGAGPQGAMRAQPLAGGAPRPPVPADGGALGRGAGRAWGAGPPSTYDDEHAREHRGPAVEMSGAWEKADSPSPANPAVGAPAWPSASPSATPVGGGAGGSNTWSDASASFMSFFPSSNGEGEGVSGSLYGDRAPAQLGTGAVGAATAAPLVGSTETVASLGTTDTRNAETFPGAS